METFFLLILLVCIIAGCCQGMKDMRNVHEGKAPGVSRDDHGHAYYFLSDFNDGGENE